MNLVTIKNLNYSYTEKEMIFLNLNLAVAENEFVFLIGKSGSGKTTLLRLIYNNLVPDEGEITFRDINYNSLNKKNNYKLRKNMGVIFQDFKLLEDRTVFDNLYFLLRITGHEKKKIKSKIYNMLSFVGLSNKVESYPSELSEGEKQRVAIARSMLNDPLLILADEPTGNLDPETTKEIMELLIKLHKRGTAIIFATHHYKLLKQDFGRIIKLQDHKAYNVKLK